MSNSVDSRIVEMKFNNADFLRGVTSTLHGLDSLKKGLKLDGATAGLEKLNKAAGGVNVGKIGAGVQQIAGKFSTMGIVGVAALASIAAQAARTGATMLSSLTLKPLQAGLQEYETNLNSVQTILANTGLEGQKGLNQVNGALSQLNTYSDQTIYNFSEMARNIGTFTAAGLDLKTSTAAIKGIANLAAISGSSSEQASTAMYQLSQAMAAGKATLVDWNSVVNAGMGGKVFQEALKETARVQGVNIDAIIKQNGSFRDSLQEGWLTTDVLSETLGKFTGDLSAAQLKAMGYNEKQIAGIIKMGNTARDAATKVKTVSQLIGTLQEAAGSGWATTFQLLFGDFEEAKTLFTNVSNVLGGFIQNSAKARNKVIGDWKALGGRTVLIDAIALAFNNVMEVLTPLKLAFRDVFPATTGKQLYQLTVALRDFLSGARLGEDTMDNLRRTFRGLFAIISIGFSILKGIGTVLLTVFRSLSSGNGSVLEFTGNIGDWLVALDKAIKSGEGFNNFFKGLGKVLTIPIKAIKLLIGFIGDLVKDIGKVGSAGVDKIGERFSPLAKIGQIISAVFSGIGALLGKVLRAFLPLTSKFEDFFNSLGDTISNGFAGADYNSILDGINTGLLAGIVLLFKKFLAGGLNFNFGGGALESLKGALDGLSGTLGAMQANLKANALLKIAGAIALLTVSVVALSLIDPKKLTSAMTGLAVMFGQLVAAMKLLDIVTSSKGFLKMPVLALGLIGLAIAIDLLVIAVSKLAGLSWEELAKGLTGVATLLISLALFTKFSAVESASGAGLLLLALAINLLVRAVQSFGEMKWSEIIKGLVGVAAMLTALALFTKFSQANKGAVAQGAGLLLLALAIRVLADAIGEMGKLSWGEIAKGLATMGGGLVLMAMALKLVPPNSVLSAAAIFVVALSLSKIGDAVAQMSGLSWGEIARGLTAMAGALLSISVALGLLPPSSLLSAAAIFVVAASLGLIADALGQMGGMSWEEIGKSLVVLAGSLTILAAAMYLMTGALPGAAATLVVAAALMLLAPVLQTFGSMPWGEIVKGLLTLVGVFLVLGVAGIALAPLVPILIGLGVAIGLMGLGMLAAGAGMVLFGIGLTAVSIAGSAAVAVLIGAVRGILKLLPEVAVALGLFVTAFANAITKSAPAVAQAITVVLLALLNMIDRLAPRIIATLLRLLLLLLTTLTRYVPKLADAGSKLIIALLDGIARNVPKIAAAATNLMVKFIEAIAKNQAKVVDAGAKMIISFVNGVADAIRNNSAALGAAGGNLASAIIEGMASGLTAGIGKIADRAASVAKGALDAAKHALGVNSPSKEFIKIGESTNEGFVIGIVKTGATVAKAAEGVGNDAIESLRTSMSGISDILTTDADFNPVIRPVLDLTDVKNSATQIQGMVATTPLEVTTSATSANTASTGYQANLDALQVLQEANAAPDVKFTQINNSPKALSTVEIYRNTKSQLSTAKGALKP